MGHSVALLHKRNCYTII